MSDFTLETALEVADSVVGLVVGADRMFRLRQELRDLRENSKTLDKLYAGGVDNWSGYTESLRSEG